MQKYTSEEREHFASCRVSGSVVLLNDITFAASRVATKYPTYDQIPPAFRTMGRYTGSTGANYFAEAMRITTEGARKHPWRLGLSIMLPQIAWQLSQASGMTNLSDEEMAEMRRGMGLFTFPIPGTGRVLDMTPSVPLADMWNDSIFRVFNADKPSTTFGTSGPAKTGVQDIRPEGFEVPFAFAKPFMAPFWEDNVAIGLGMNALYGRDNFGNKIEDGDRITGERGLRGLFSPSAVNQGLKVREALKHDVDKRGNPIDKVEQISRQLGVRVARQGPDELKESLKSLRLSLAGERKKLKSAIIKINKNQQLTADEKREQKADKKDSFKSVRDRTKERMEEIEAALEAKKKR